MDLARICFLLAAISLVLGFVVLIGVLSLGIGWVALFVLAAIFAIVGYALGGSRGRPVV